MVQMSTFSSSLSLVSESALVALFEARPDLATPAPASLSSLAARATNRLSIEYILADLSSFEYQVLESVVILESVTGEVVARQLASALPQASDEELGAATTRLLDLLLVWQSDEGLRPAPGLGEILGNYPAGLGPVLPSSPAPEDLTQILAQAPPAAMSILNAMTWGPPVAKLPSRYDPRAESENRTEAKPDADAKTEAGKAAAQAVRWLLQHELVGLTENQHVVLPRSVGLHLRGGVIYRECALQAPAELVAASAPEYRDAQGAHEATETVRLMGRLLEELAQHPAQPIRSGALAQRELRRIRLVLQTDEPATLRLLELSHAAGFIGLTRHPEVTFTTTAAGQAWLGHSLAQRWAQLAEHWLVSPRASWLVGATPPGGSEQLGICDPNHSWSWLPRVKQRLLELLRDYSAFNLTTQALEEVFTWHRPRLIPEGHRDQTLNQLCSEATWLGLYAPHGLTSAANALLSEADPVGALEAALPQLVPDMIIQSDLTAIIPGRPTPDLYRLIETCAEVESRGSAITIRFTEASITAALDAGFTPARLIDQLATYSRTAVPQPLEYLISDTARKHGALRVGLANAYLRVEDPVTAELILTNEALSELGLIHVAPTVIVSQADPQEFITALRAQGFSPSADPVPSIVTSEAGRQHKPSSSVLARISRQQATSLQSHQEMLERHRSLAKRLKTNKAKPGGKVAESTSEEREQASASGKEVANETKKSATRTAPTREASHVVLQLREAIATGQPVTIELIGTKGVSQTRDLVPLSLDSGRLRGRDVERQTELTVALHRISNATIMSGSGGGHSDD